MATTSGVTTANEDRALSLLGSGTSAAQTASALGVTESYISQLLSRDDFSREVIKRKCEVLERHNKRDNKYDALEDTILDKMHEGIAMVFDPMKLARLLQVTNAAKRRGVGADSNVSQVTTSISLVLPQVIIEKFSANTYNQVIEAGDQQLITMQVGTLLERLKGKQNDITPIDGIKEIRF